MMKDEKKLLSFGVKAVFTPKDFRIEEIMKQITDILKNLYDLDGIADTKVRSLEDFFSNQKTKVT